MPTSTTPVPVAPGWASMRARSLGQGWGGLRAAVQDQHAGCPNVVTGAVGAGGGHVVVVVVGAADGVDGVGQDAGGRVGSTGVRADPVGLSPRPAATPTQFRATE